MQSKQQAKTAIEVLDIDTLIGLDDFENVIPSESDYYL